MRMHFVVSRSRGAYPMAEIREHLGVHYAMVS
mgnify:CR=1 FL=1|jgi:hypothetical protein